MTNVTIKDIAKALNLSTSTVSRALRDSYEISADTKKKVTEYAKSVHYTPNPIALSLKENKSHSICVIVPEIANNFFSEVINGIDFTAFQRGYHVVIFQTYESFEREQANLENGLARRADGIIMSLSGTTENFEYLDKLRADNIPIVFFDRVPPIENCYKVVSDNLEGAYKATQHLISQGKKRIAHITSPPVLSITKERLAGYKAALTDNNIEIDQNLIRYCGFEPKEAFQTIDDLITNHHPDSFFICSDRLALNCFEGIKKNKNILAGDICLVGYTNLKTAHLLDPPLTTIRQPAFEMGQQATELLLNILHAKGRTIPYQTITLKNELIVR